MWQTFHKSSNRTRITAKIGDYTRSNKKKRTEYHTDFMVSKSWKLFSNMYGFQSDATIFSYTPKKNKIVTLLSTMHNVKGI